MNNPDHISESLKPFFCVKIRQFFDADPGWKKFGSGMEKFGSGINIPDPQHWSKGKNNFLLSSHSERSDIRFEA
jgi:hypothetical protein